MNMKILWIIPIMGIFLYLALFIAEIKISYKMNQLEKKLKGTNQDKSVYEIWLEEIKTF